MLWAKGVEYKHLWYSIWVLRGKDQGDGHLAFRDGHGSGQELVRHIPAYMKYEINRKFGTRGSYIFTEDKIESETELQ